MPCFALVTAAVGLAAVALQGLVGKIGTLVVAVFFIVLGGASAGGGGVALLPTYWQRIGALFPPRYAIELYRNVRYFDGHNITTAIAVLAAYAIVGAVVIVLVERRSERADPTTAVQQNRTRSSRRRGIGSCPRILSPRWRRRSCSPRCSP